MEKGCHILDGTYPAELNHKSGKLIGIGTFPRDKCQMLLTDIAAIMTNHFLYVRPEHRAFTPYGDGPDVSDDDTVPDIVDAAAFRTT
jgi:hypothetical protein